ncbi:MAG: DUF427 domain-containing protein [Acidimicrobiia bacterium]|nr:DUF427 domain-containing protein [Acidimicrobiia bacterium]
MTTKTRSRIRVEPARKRVRTAIGGTTIADSTNALMVWETRYYPTYYFPRQDVRFDLLTDSGETKRSPSRGTAGLHDITVVDRTVHQAALVWDEAKIPELEGYVSFDWAAMDRWFEEDEEVYVHARDPYTRVDILQSSRTVRVEVDGVTVAESSQPRILFETGMPARYYLPKTDVRFEHLVPTDTETRCPYKGTARYWSIEVNGEIHSDLAWGYDAPLPESQKIAGYVAFYNEKLDIYIDGELEERPKTPFS